MKVVLTFVIMIPTLIFSVLSYQYTYQILEYRNLKEKEITEAFELMNDVEEIFALTPQEFFNGYEIKHSISTTTKEATIHVFEYEGYDFVYIENTE
ncbi:hypothetical protein [Petrotoga olearia]|uniref:Sensor histidine kinase n=2 Tax=Petrotoga olearia TaxID=156203 RepID=A0A2K1P3C0_9BACT|nr:hypothetical protein [Petrotoga olearia]PNR97293.1 hypothetical protein X929_03310 [Petrotoga olearia DSM 13574]RMA76709.1 hypothetical protein C8D75_0365 [Petrotoga olearia]